MASDQSEVNRRFWQSRADQYQARHGALLHAHAAAWGTWRIPESSLQILGAAAAKDILEFGCGAAQWSMALARKQARVVGLDFSARQLDHARRLQREAGVTFPLVCAEGHEAPFPDASFDIVFCDHGVLSWTDPRRSVPEAARLLRPGGLLAFCISSPLSDLCRDEGTNHIEAALHREHHDVHLEEGPEEVFVTLSYGEWIRTFCRSGLVVEDLVELLAPEGATSSYDLAPVAWASRWPAEVLWKARKPPTG